MTVIHVNRPRGQYIGQVRKYGHRLWVTVTRPKRTAERALAATAPHITGDIKRARVLFLDSSGYYEPHICMEVRRG